MDKAYEFLLNEAGFRYGDAVVIAVSGGPDSMALLHLMIKIKKALDLELICAHVNHNVRVESDYEKDFVEKFCAKNNIIFEYMKIEDYGDDNFHNEARSKRYAYFADIVRKYHAKFLLTAHHADDLMETILMRLVRGSTLRGYSGFSKIINMKNYVILRPFIEIPKSEIIAYNKINKIKCVQDKSNNKDIYTRNRFRKYIVPLFKKEDPNVHQKFYKFSKILLEYNDYIDKQVQKIINDVYPQGILNIEKFLQEEHVIQMKIIYYILEYTYQDDLMLITDHHAELIYNLIRLEKANGKIHLPNNIKAIKSYNNLVLMREEMKSDEYEIEIIDYVSLPNGKNIEVVDSCDETNNNVCRLNSEEIKLPLHVRNRQTGDRMWIKGMLGWKKLSDIFIDSKIPIKERELWPVVVDSNDTIVWLPGLKKSKFDKTKKEKYDIILKYY
ncbi:MAG: tRNA lysidine(34) synthetase TilS [Mollicutes bacterium]|nr:tRNA lysidine(34) synthetase TilS [Mollicutes bacterium]